MMALQRHLCRVLMPTRWPDPTACEFLHDGLPHQLCRVLIPTRWPDPTAREFLHDGSLASPVPSADADPMA